MQFCLSTLWPKVKKGSSWKAAEPALVYPEIFSYIKVSHCHCLGTGALEATVAKSFGRWERVGIAMVT